MLILTILFFITSICLLILLSEFSFSLASSLPSNSPLLFSSVAASFSLLQW